MQLSEVLESRGIRASYQRLRIYQELSASQEHPSAEQLYVRLVGEIPSLSRTTVYNTLNLLVQHQLARLITIENNELRYDAMMEEHGHFKCEICGKVSNFSIHLDLNLSPELENCVILEQNVYVIGTCKACWDKII
ncbi:Fur family transcriptional regulator [Entomospira culicis]|uniref:Transcriptional repressor n=1 Tax=Entomospira culicis TaxID=2719989 RepID=A0A968GGE7_9SPIO|nr:Fur family transcriptional regulator [Entomospira culicis]NIZ19862.1 transcriptional repressor [Entomospira culicis]NIZ70076.1 transcriptional repressor [Entomospira culicis]WDI37180.1 Fur family transcriptional regulator [Entomospira culicis]WDI38809.1 Fur family transcriptional regulator [Entomospira culicis]